VSVSFDLRSFQNSRKRSIDQG